jgi:methylthioribulose-1-phosphate dehydratase
MGKPSAETSIHVSIYKNQTNANCIVHGHTMEANVFQPTYPVLEGYALHELPVNELIKAFGIWEQDPKVKIPLFYNDINVPNISISMDHYFLNYPNPLPTLLVVSHGVTSWGTDPEDALKVFEATEFLLGLENRKSK